MTSLYIRCWAGGGTLCLPCLAVPGGQQTCAQRQPKAKWAGRDLGDPSAQREWGLLRRTEPELRGLGGIERDTEGQGGTFQVRAGESVRRVGAEKLAQTG